MLQERDETGRTPEQIERDDNPCLDCQTPNCSERTAEYKPKNLKELLQIFDIEYISEFEHLKRFFDIDKPDADGQPTINTEQKTVIITDNIIFNETYLIDVINEYLVENSGLVSAVKFVYIDKISIRNKLLANNIRILVGGDIDSLETLEQSLAVSVIDGTGKTLGEANLHDFEKTYLSPSILTINPLTNEISVNSEGFSPFNKDQIKKIFIDTKISE